MTAIPTPPTATATAASSPSANSSNRLMLHFDVNKTILIGDVGSGVSMEQMINAILSECVYGRVDNTTHEWHRVGEPTTTPPHSPNDAGEQILSYGRYLETVKYVDRAGAEHRESNFANKVARRNLKVTFTHEGQPGASLINYANELDTALRFPKSIIPPPMPETATEEKNPFKAGHHEEPYHTWSLGYYHLLPSFFELLLHLQATKRDVAIIFRTFGIDGVDIAKELNLFVSGRHPCYPHVCMDGSPASGGYDLRVSLADNAAVFYRERHPETGESIVSIVSNTLHTVPPGQDLSYYTSESFTKAPTARVQPVTITHGITNVLPTIRKMIHDAANKAARVALLRDHHPYWALHAEGSHAGKLMILDTPPPSPSTTSPSSSTSSTSSRSTDSSGAGGATAIVTTTRPGEPVVHQIFFDDNIERDEAHIVDLRYADGSEVPFEYGRGRHLWRSEPFDAIHNKHYFIDSLATAEKLFAAASASASSS